MKLREWVARVDAQRGGGRWAPMKYGLLLAAVLLVPSVLFNCAVEGGARHPEVRITPGVELLEMAALAILALSFFGVLYLAVRWRVGGLRGVIAAISQLAVIVIAPLVVLFSRGGGLFDHPIRSSPARGGGTLHLVGGSCSHAVYLQRPFALTMQRKMELRMQHPDDIVTIDIDDTGHVSLLDKDGRPVVINSVCNGIFD